MKKIFLFALFILLTNFVFAGAAFSEARDKEDNTLTWTFYVFDKVSPNKACDEAKKLLKKDGHKEVLCPASSTLDHGFYSVVFSYYEAKEQIRFRYGFGFSKVSVEEAEKDAVKNLAKTDKLWTPKELYTVKTSAQF